MNRQTRPYNYATGDEGGAVRWVRVNSPKAPPPCMSVHLKFTQMQALRPYIQID
ncbi:MAG: hypothetical protein RIM23_24500 [Coleofasciculus sp. G3-WIS-01]|uniref:hypothetical protein n=1 Tax=Coleofasciculus sp. G3-WIS-01 TaxID=3069528 RepID=UPI0032FE4DA7